MKLTASDSSNALAKICRAMSINVVLQNTEKLQHCTLSIIQLLKAEQPSYTIHITNMQEMSVPLPVKK